MGFGPKAHKSKLDLLEGKIFFTRNSEASLAALMKKAPFQFILMLTFRVPVSKGMQGNECIYENSCEHN